jgi:hypothetical protein
MDFIPFDREKDYPTLALWWEGHHAPAMPLLALPVDGWVAVMGGVQIAMAFVYIARDGSMAMIEWTTTNPQCAFSRNLLEAVKGLWTKLEEEAKKAGCFCVLSMVKPGSSESRLLPRLGYVAGGGRDPGHHMYAKSLCQQ